MVTAASQLLNRIRDPAYTGRNRCRPCTVLNLVIAMIVAGGLFLISEPLGVLSFLGFAAVIYLRGYLVPGTPELTQRYFPAWLLRWFGKRSSAEPATARASVELSEELSRAGVRSRTEPSGLAESFTDAWRARFEDLQGDETSHEELARIIDVDADTITYREYGDGFAVSVAGVGASRWPSRIAFEADLATAAELRSRGIGISTDLTALGATVEGVRALLTACPACDGALETAERTAVACCGESVTPVRTCADCGARMYEYEPAAGEQAG